MNRVVIPTGDWQIALADAVNNADDQTVIVVDTEAKKELALRFAERRGKTVNVEVGTSVSSLAAPYTMEELLRTDVGRSECPRCRESNCGQVPCPNCGAWMKD